MGENTDTVSALLKLSSTAGVNKYMVKKIISCESTINKACIIIKNNWWGKHTLF